MFSRNLVKCIISRSYSSPSTITAAKRIIRQTTDKVKEDIITKMLKGKLIKSPEEWNGVRQEILQYKSHITTQNIDAIILGFYTTAENYQMAEKYIEFLKSQGLKMNLATIGKYFRLNFLLYKKKMVPKSKEMELLETYENLRKTYPVLDSTTLTNLIEGLSVTSQWQYCVDLLNEVKLNGEPGAPAYNAVVSCLFRNNEDILAWKLLQEMLEKEQNPSTSCFIAYIEHIRRNCRKQKDIITAFEKLFNLFQQNDIRCDHELLTELSNALSDFKFEANFSKRTHLGAKYKKEVHMNINSKVYISQSSKEVRTILTNNLSDWNEIVNACADNIVFKAINLSHSEKTVASAFYA